MSFGVNLGLDSIINKMSGESIESQRSNKQRLLDNEYRDKQTRTQEKWNKINFDESRYRLTNLATDARRAGVSMMAALGAGGSAPANITVPAGQGGRVSGTYSRNSPSASMSLQSESKPSDLDNQIKQAQLTGMQYDNLNRQTDGAIKQKKLRDMYFPQQGGLPPKYMRFLDNYDEAVGWISDGDFVYLNPEMNMEMPETIGGIQFAKPYPEGWAN